MGVLLDTLWQTGTHKNHNKIIMKDLIILQVKSNLEKNNFERQGKCFVVIACPLFGSSPPSFTHFKVSTKENSERFKERFLVTERLAMPMTTTFEASAASSSPFQSWGV